MLDDADFCDWCSRLRLTQAAREAIAAVRSGRPTRCVGGGRRNVAGRFPSRKMGVTIQFESHRVELPFIYEAEHDSAVLEYYDQPPSIPLSYCAANGRRLSVMHTPDYFVLRDGSAGWIECKTEEDLEALASRSPNRYSRDDGKKWRYIPGENYAATVGLVYEVWSAAQFNWVLHRNLQFLEDYLRLSSVTTADFVNPAIIATIEAEPGMTLRNLLEKARGVAEPDDIYMLVASGAIHVDLNAAPIAEPERVRVFLTAEMAAACEFVCQAACAESDIRGNDGRPRGSPDERSEVFRALVAASEQDLTIANQRADIVRQHLAGGNPSRSTPARTLRLWTAQYRSARELYGSGYLGLLPKTGKRGNRTSRLPETSRELLSQFVENDYLRRLWPAADQNNFIHLW